MVLSSPLVLYCFNSGSVRLLAIASIFIRGKFRYIKLEPDSRGIIYSQVFPSLWLDVNALLAGNLGQVLTVLQQGLASQEHQDFLKILSQKKQ